PPRTAAPRTADDGDAGSRVEDWCERGDSNPHALRRSILSRLRLPVPSLSPGADSARAIDNPFRRRNIIARCRAVKSDALRAPARGGRLRRVGGVAKPQSDRHAAPDVPGPPGAATTLRLDDHPLETSAGDTGARGHRLRREFDLSDSAGCDADPDGPGSAGAGMADRHGGDAR